MRSIAIENAARARTRRLPCPLLLYHQTTFASERFIMSLLRPCTAPGACVFWLYALLIASGLLLTGCAGRSAFSPQEQQTIVVLPTKETLPIATLAPVFLLQGTQLTYNRIGRVVASGSSDQETITIDTQSPTIYTERRPFTTERGLYTNLIYRIHFSELPYSLIPFHLGAGKHVGLLVILTLDARQRVLLVTTANTCGCYALTIPTATLPPSSYPEAWPMTPIPLYGERLPARLPAIGTDDVLQAVIRADVHRIMDLQVVARASLVDKTGVPATMLPLDILDRLPLDDGGTTSLYYKSWPLSGHVKGAIKPWESLLLSLVSLDFFVGMDKEYGDTGKSGNPFYTSLKPWNRSASDLNDFPAYLRFNGWKL